MVANEKGVLTWLYWNLDGARHLREGDPRWSLFALNYGNFVQFREDFIYLTIFILKNENTKRGGNKESPAKMVPIRSGGCRSKSSRARRSLVYA